MDTPDIDCVGNADAMRQAQGYTFCVYPPDDVGNADAISNARLTIMQSAEFFRILSVHNPECLIFLLLPRALIEMSTGGNR